MFTIGIDESGRGSLAGPVTVSAVLVPRGFWKKDLRDSKDYTAKQREEVFSYIKEDPRIFHVTSFVYPRVIERVNISEAVNLAATRALKRLVDNVGVDVKKCSILLDGSIKLNSDLKYKVFIRGDKKIISIKLASVAAKVSRDSAMRRLHKKYEEYSFYQHKGYGTEEHRLLIKRHGSCEVHRKTFKLI